MAGYSGTPLPQKLGIKAGHVVALDAPPRGFASTLGALPQGVRLVTSPRGSAPDVILLFVRNRKAFEARLEPSIARMAPDTSLWICWPKKTSPLASDVNEDTVRERGLAAGLVDVKICAVDEDWSGLKFIYRLEDRPKIARKPGRKR